MILPKLLGKIAYIVTWPGIRLLLLNSQRAYLVIQVGNEVFVTKNWLGLHKKWRLPGGGLKNNEDKIKGLARELNEEIGLDLTKYQVTTLTASPISNSAGYQYSLYQLKIHKKPALNIDQQEIADYAWIDIGKIPAHLCSEELKYFKKNCI